MSNENQLDKYSQLCEAIKRKDKEKIRQLILNNVDVNSKTVASPQSPLHWAIIKFDDTEIIELLLEKNADILDKNFHNQTPLELTVMLSRVEAFQLLMSKGVSLDYDKLNSLMYTATVNGSLKIVRVLVNWATKNNVAVDRQRSFDVAVKEGHPTIVKYFIPYLDFEKPRDKYILREVVLKDNERHKNCVNILLQNGFTVNPSHFKDNSYVYASVKNGYLKIVEELLKLGVDVNLRNRTTGFTLLHAACLNKHLEIVELLLNNGADVNVMVTWGVMSVTNVNQFLKSEDLVRKSALHIAVMNTNEKIVKLFFDKGAKFIDDANFFSIVHQAIQSNRLKILEVLLDQGGNINAVNLNKETFLHLCAKIKNESDDQTSTKHQLAELLLNRGAIVDAQDNNENTPLFHAVKNENFEMIKVLLKYNANSDFADGEGITALHVACKQKSKSIVQLLLFYNANPNVINKKGKAPLHIASKNMDQEIIKSLLESKADANIKDESGQTALHIACQDPHCDSLDVIKLLLQHNADTEVVDNKGKTPLFYACEEIEKFSDMSLAKIDYESMIEYATRCKMNTWGIDVISWWKIFNSAKLLLANKADICVVDQDGLTLLHVVAEKDDLELTENFIKMGIEVNSVDEQGQTPLHLAAGNGSAKVVDTLLKHAADANILTNDSKTALQYAFDGITRLENEHHDNYKRKINSYIATVDILKEHILELQSDRFTVNKQNIHLIHQNIKIRKNAKRYKKSS